ncbi:MAG: DUF2779 domain-containing protein [Deltaproteobacteria bacterium]|nr:DUF2779 domain-containing protein [Deltaproteobacteria bacterium]
MLVIVDILHRGAEGWEIYEVKSSTEVKDVHLYDLAVQYHVLKCCGLDISRTCLVHINNEYVRQGEIEVSGLFTIADLTADVAANQKFVVEELNKMKKMLGGECPVIDIGTHCYDPYECDFMGHCWAHIPDNSVFDLARLNLTKKFGLYYDGVVSFKDIPEDYPLSDRQLAQVDAELTGREIIDRDGIKEFLDSLHYPLYFLDFETFRLAVPPFDGVRPYEQVPFQYSIHALNGEGVELEHYEFLAEPGTDAREEIAKRFVETIPEGACVVAYNMSFEKMIIRSLADRLPAYRDRLMEMHDSMADLMEPFRKLYYYKKEMCGSYSIKKVLPALVPEMSYEGMEVSNGDEAMGAYLSLQFEVDKNRIESVRRALLKYCWLDTLAMVKLLEKLREVVK